MRQATEVRANRRFYQDARSLPSEIARKLDACIRDLRAHGARHDPFHTRRIEGNKDSRFHFMNVDNKWRIVAALEGNFVFLEKVGNHDETLNWGVKASLDEYRERLEVRPGVFQPQKKGTRPTPEEALFVQTLTLPLIVAQEAIISDLIADDLGAQSGYVEGSIEDWMIFLSPLQRRAVERSVHGPARVTGGPGTGKTVVGLHRALAFAKRIDAGRVLVTSYVNTVPKVLEGLFERLAPEQREKVAFRSIHSLAESMLEERGLIVRVDEDSSRRRFRDRLAADQQRLMALRTNGLSEQYLWDECGRVIEGRRIRSLAGYLALSRHGRKRVLQEPVRRLIWSLYGEYREACDRMDPPVVDWSQHLALAADAAEAGPASERYEAIIVDEAQDISESGIAMLIAMLRGGKKGQLLLVSDNGQRIYPGGFRLADLGLEVRGRSFLLSPSYRSTDEIMLAAGALGRFLSPEDFGEDGVRDMSLHTTRSGSRPSLNISDTPDEERAAVVSRLKLSPDALDSSAILVPTNRLAESWRRVLHEAELPTCSLLEYSGRPLPGVKIGTYNRAKGLEFKTVYLPNLTAHGLRTDSSDPDELVLRGSQLYVAVTRARDLLHLSFAGEASLFVDPIVPFVDLE